MSDVGGSLLNRKKEFALMLLAQWQLTGDGRVMAGRETFGCNSSAAFRGFMATIWIPGASAAI